MKWRSDGTLQTHAGGCKPLYTAVVEGFRMNVKARRNRIEHIQSVIALHRRHITELQAEIDAEEALLDQEIEALDRMNGGMHRIVTGLSAALRAPWRMWPGREPTPSNAELKALAATRAA